MYMVKWQGQTKCLHLVHVNAAVVKKIWHTTWDVLQHRTDGHMLYQAVVNDDPVVDGRVENSGCIVAPGCLLPMVVYNYRKQQMIYLSQFSSDEWFYKLPR